MYDVDDIVKYYINKNLRWKEDEFSGNRWVAKEWWTKHKIERSYSEARILFEIPIDFEGFNRKIEYELGHKIYRYYSNSKRKREGRYGHYPWDKRSSYRRKPEHKKKELSTEEIDRREWREKKKVKKDKSKPSYRRGAGKWYKKYSNTLHRQWEREMIHAERWDEMSNKDYTLFLDPWLWD